MEPPDVHNFKKFVPSPFRRGDELFSLCKQCNRFKKLYSAPKGRNNSKKFYIQMNRYLSEIVLENVLFSIFRR